MQFSVVTPSALNGIRGYFIITSHLAKDLQVILIFALALMNLEILLRNRMTDRRYFVEMTDIDRIADCFETIPFLPVSGGWGGVRRRRIFHADAELLTCGFPFPNGRQALLGGCNERQRAVRAFLDAAAAEPALLSEHDDRLPAFHRVRDHHVARTDVDAAVAADALVGIKG